MSLNQLWVVELVWVGCFGGVGMCTVVGSSLNWCRLVVLVLNFSMVERWVSGFVWLVVCFGGSIVGILVVGCCGSLVVAMWV